MRGGASTVFVWAFAASIAAHTLVLAFPVSRAGIAAGNERALEVRLIASEKPVELVAPALTLNTPLVAPALALNTPLVPPIEQAAPPSVTATPLPPSPAEASDVTAAEALPDVEVESRPLADRAVLGDLLSREQTDFPIEIDVPPRIEGRIAATYPKRALLEGREGLVTVWVVVDERGLPDEIQVVDGTDEFAGAVVTAISNARFQPARNNLVPIRFPVSMEFQFALGATAPLAQTGTTATP